MSRVCCDANRLDIKVECAEGPFRKLENRWTFRDEQGISANAPRSTVDFFIAYEFRSAALGLVQVGRIDELLARRAQVAEWYNQRLADVELVERPWVAPSTTRMSWFVYVVRVRAPASRDTLMRRLAEEHIPSRPYFTPIHLQPFYMNTFGYARGDFPVTEMLGDVSLALPFSGVMSEAQVDYVADRVRRIVAEC